MLFSTKAEYGVRLMVELGRRVPGDPESGGGPDLISAAFGDGMRPGPTGSAHRLRSGREQPVPRAGDLAGEHTDDLYPGYMEGGADHRPRRMITSLR